jgi:hypothetical protein
MLAVMVGWTLFILPTWTRPPLTCAACSGCGFAPLGYRHGDYDGQQHFLADAFGFVLCAAASARCGNGFHLDTANRDAGWALTGALTGLQLAVLLICTALLVGNSYNPFLYFRF